MSVRGVYPEPAGAKLLSSGAYGEFADFRNIVEVIEHVSLGSGEKGRALLGVNGRRTGDAESVAIDSAVMTFDDIALTRDKSRP